MSKTRSIINSVNKIEFSAYFIILLLSSYLRLAGLETKSMHHDESLHAYYAWIFSQGGGLIHNPMLHGPLQMQLSGFIFFIFGDNDFTARVLYALAGICLSFVPFLLRNHLGKYGAVVSAFLIAISPTMIYFSRFARNDILMAVITLLLIVTVWKYLQNGHTRNMYWTAGLLALAYTTKETSYLITGIIGLYLILSIGVGSYKNRTWAVNTENDPYPKIIFYIFREFIKTISVKLKNRDTDRQLSLLILIFTLTLPQWSAFASILELVVPSVVLVNENVPRQIGMPVGIGNLVALMTVIGLFSFSIYVGIKWNWRIWLKCAGIFYLIWLLSYTTFFSNITSGIKSGIWQSLGYWVVQQGEGRGGQPSYYYVVLSSIYEYLPMLFAAFAVIQLTRKRDALSVLLAYWVIITFILYTLASEKMPWLLVNVTLPAIILAGKYLGEKIQALNSSKFIKDCATSLFFRIAIFLNIALAIFFISGIILYKSMALYGLIFFCICFILVVALLLMRLRHLISDYPITLFLITVAIILAGLTLKTGITVSVQNQDTPVEMLVYTQTSPQVRVIAQEITNIRNQNPLVAPVKVTVDQTSGFTWPWTWYLRNHEDASFPQLTDTSDLSDTDSDILLVHSNNRISADTTLSDEFSEGITYPHRWWFPEYTYRNLSIVDYFTGNASLIKGLNYWLFRTGVVNKIGSEDGVLYHRRSLDSSKQLTDRLRNR